MSIKDALSSLNSSPVATKVASNAGQKVSQVSYDSSTRQMTVVISNVDLNYERGTRLDKVSNTQVPNNSIKLMQVGKGQFGQNVFGVKIDKTPVRCNMAFRLNLSNEQHQKDSDMIIG